MKKIILIIIVFSIHLIGFSQSIKRDTVFYKQKDSISLMMEVHYPSNMEETKKYPGMLLIPASDWNYGWVIVKRPFAEYFAKRGIVCFSVEYGRMFSKPGQYAKCITDVKSAMRYVRENADKLNVDDNKIAAWGESAGGHLAMSLESIKGFDDPNDNLEIEVKPNALILYAPAIELGPQFDKDYKRLSPLQHLKKGAPPTFLSAGTEDEYLPVEALKRYKGIMNGLGIRCDLVLYEGGKHISIHSNLNLFKEHIFKIDEFLISLDYLEGEPTIMHEKLEPIGYNPPPPPGTKFENICVAGTATGQDVKELMKGKVEFVNLEENPSNENVWTTQLKLELGWLVFTNPESSKQKWGGSTFPEGEAKYSGPNIKVDKAGTYHITIDLNNNTYKFELVEE
jgi:acetyl esterase/lipase